MQTDSRLLGGDSGGPLFDFDGKVIAIHSRISKRPDQNFHVPIESFRANWDFFRKEKLLTNEKIEKGGFLGVSCEEREEGLVIQSIVPNSAAEQAGLRQGDILLRINNQPIVNREKLTILISTKDVSEKVVIRYKRENKAHDLSLRLGSRLE